MGYFTIDLPGNIKGEVRFGKVMRKLISINPFNLLKRNGLKREERRGYIVKIAEGQLYRLLRTMEGEWLNESDSGFQVAKDDETSLAIKKAIEQYEQSLHH
ncbi:hypothetical protein Q4E93_18765 [Flavitalea sp. BT771]|uniref:hypothetical protein n=1 Tax=Flavitalea sp. BT771 TaxID=3063329 RepID=UPI0026E16DBE|nr:hypothetical protein [Flavitalea sp. BT771]MDO6432655.1 hypothetical protein [Flavitalea sp. BT771]MDV6222069.1 hypothetical protein [Flavitalea sp. BT771]